MSNSDNSVPPSSLKRCTPDTESKGAASDAQLKKTDPNTHKKQQLAKGPASEDAESQAAPAASDDRCAHV